VQSDPINGNDPTGLIERAPCEPEDPDPFCDPEPFPEPGPGPRQPPDDPLPSCDDMANLDMYDEGTLDLIKRVFNENSFPKLGQPGWDIATGTPSGPSITWDTVQSEDLALASTVVNRANATNVSIAYASTTQAAGVGHPLYSPTFDGRWRALELPGSDVSPDCSNLAQIISAVVQVLTTGPVYPFLSWGGLSGVKQRDLPPGAFVIDLTVFYPGLTHP